jgi:hypothetical protein
MRVAILLFFLSTAGFARTWSGFLVDAHCWANLQSNMSENMVYGEQSMTFDVHDCSPTKHTKLFNFIPGTWKRLKLDCNGNLRAAQLVQRLHKEPVYEVNVSGVLTKKKTLKVASITPRTLKTASRHATYDY